MKCQHCGAVELAEGDIEYCDECRSEYYNWCKVCLDYQRFGYECKHIEGVDSEALYFGCGSDEVTDQCHKESFMSVVTVLHERLAHDEFQAVRNAIAGLRFLAYYDGLRLWLYNALGYEFQCTRLKPIAMLDNDSLEDSLRREELAIGWAWLESLELNKTDDANAQTVAWIDEWLVTLGER